jgi:hypothetical protein
MVQGHDRERRQVLAQLPAIAPYLDLLPGSSPQAVAARMGERFTYVAQPIYSYHWPSRGEIFDDVTMDRGELRRGNCVFFAFCCAYVLHDLGVPARVVTGACETGEAHMVCEDEKGNVYDNRFPGRLLTWDELEQIGYRSARMNSLYFEVDAEPDWLFVKVKDDGTRDYA